MRVRTGDPLRNDAGGKCAVGLAMLTGPGDIMTALRGATGICTDFYESPDRVRVLAEICTNAWMAVQQYQMNLIEPLQGGYCNNYSIWTPGRSTYFADDVSALLSGIADDLHGVGAGLRRHGTMRAPLDRNPLASLAAMLFFLSSPLTTARQTGGRQCPRADT